MKLATLIIALSLSGVILCLGVTLFVSARQSTTQTDMSFTTIAVPNFTTLIKASGLYDATRSYPATSEEWSNYNAARSSFIDLYEQLVQNAAEYAYTKNGSPKAYIGYSPLFTPLTSKSANHKEVNSHILDTPYNYAIFVATCYKFEDVEYTDADGNLEILKNSKLVWKVDDVVSLGPGYNKPDYMRSDQSTISYLPNDNLTHTLSDYFVVGKQYIVLGIFTDNGIIVKPKEIDGVIDPKEREYVEDDASLPMFTIFDAKPAVSEQSELIYSEKDGMIEADLLPYAEITEDLDGFLSSDDGDAWRTITNNINTILHSAYVVSSDNIQSILSFNQYESNIVNGRYITQNEYTNGSNVCIINKNFAEYNDLKIGDSIPLSLHAVYHHIDEFDPSGNIPTWYRNVYPYELELSDPKEYKIVGIYQSPEWSNNPYSLSPNTIFVPMNSIENPPVFSESVQLLLTSGLLIGGTILDHPASAIITIPNYKIEEVKKQLVNETYNDYKYIDPFSGQAVFENKLNKEDFANFFIFYDQGYSTVSSTLKAMNLYSLVILVFCILVWCATLCFFVYIFIFKQRQELGILLSLGLAKKKALQQLFINCLIIALISIVITGTTAIISADNIINQVYSMLLLNEEVQTLFATELNASRDKAKLIGISNLASESSLSEINGVRISFFDGYDESVLQGDEPICLINERLYDTLDGNRENINIKAKSFDHIFAKQKPQTAEIDMKIVGVIQGGKPYDIYCSFNSICEIGSISDGSDPYTESMSAIITDNNKLNEFKEKAKRYYTKVDISMGASEYSFALTVYDSQLINATTAINKNLHFIKLASSVILFLSSGIGFFVCFLCTKNRNSEFALLRSLGMSKFSVIRMAMLEQLILSLIALIISFSVVIFSNDRELGFTYNIVFFLFFMAGGFFSMHRTIFSNILKNLRGE